MFDNEVMRLRLYKSIRQRVDSDEVAEDLLQETYERAVRSIGSLRDENSVVIWMHVIARNVCNSYWREQYREEKKIERMKEVLSDPSQQHYPRERRDTGKLHDLLALLPERQRWLLAMRYERELCSREMSTLLHVTPEKVRMELHRVRNVLRAAL